MALIHIKRAPLGDRAWQMWPEAPSWSWLLGSCISGIGLVGVGPSQALVEQWLCCHLLAHVPPPRAYPGVLGPSVGPCESQLSGFHVRTLGAHSLGLVLRSVPAMSQLKLSRHRALPAAGPQGCVSLGSWSGHSTVRICFLCFPFLCVGGFSLESSLSGILTTGCKRG